ncbi:MAG: IPT/TIG domain-containing protein [Terriglobia bacterium]
MRKQERGIALFLCIGLAAFTWSCGGGGGGGSSPPPPSGGGGSITLSSLQPIVQMQNAQSFVLTLNGSGFASGDQVVFNGAAEPATAVSSTQLTATIPSSAVASPATLSVKVQSATSSSGSLNFYVVPAISPSPVTITVGAPSTVNLAVPAFNPPSLLLEAIGGVQGPGPATSAANGAVLAGPGQSINLFVVGNGITAGTFYEVSGANDVSVTEPIAADFTHTTDTPPVPAVNFNIAVSSSAAAGPRTLIVTNPAGEVSIVSGGIIVQ